MMENGKAKTAGALAGFGLLLVILLQFEGTEPVAYLDPVGIPTVCTGHTGPDVHVGQQYSDERCRAMLEGDALKAWDDVSDAVHVPLLDYQHAAFASFDFNVGRSAFLGSTMLRLINAGQIAVACNELPRWVYAGAHRQILPGLVKRREAERRLCLGATP